MVQPNELKDRDKQIYESRKKKYSKIKGIRIGDYVRFPNGYMSRVTHIWEDGHIQAGGSSGGQYYFGDGYISYSGSLSDGFSFNNVIVNKSSDYKIGSVWFFHNGFATAGGGVDTYMYFRIFDITPVVDDYKVKELKEVIKRDRVSRPIIKTLRAVLKSNFYKDAFWDIVIDKDKYNYEVKKEYVSFDVVNSVLREYDIKFV
jgi:hypothetical protein